MVAFDQILQPGFPNKIGVDPQKVNEKITLAAICRLGCSPARSQNPLVPKLQFGNAMTLETPFPVQTTTIRRRPDLHLDFTPPPLPQF
jgi:hypothetical protein